MLIGALFLSAVLLTIVIVARRAWGNRGACVVAGLGIPTTYATVLCMIWSPVLTLEAFLLFLVALGCLIASANQKVFVTISIAAASLSYVVAGLYSANELRNEIALEDRYPYEWVRDRLTYEKPARTAPMFSEETLSSLDTEVIGHNGLYRAGCLRKLHESHVLKFINSPGFGVARTLFQPTDSNLRTDETEAIPLRPSTTETWPTEGKDLDKISPQHHAEELARIVFGKLHTTSLVDFVNPKGFGYIADKDHVAGFQSHQFHELPKLDAPRWQLRHLELVSLLKFDEPAVYVTDHLPRMDDLRDAPTRLLNGFERTHLQALQEGEDLAVDSNPDRIYMLGSIRAGKQCLQCHTAERGALLGAFSYQFCRVAP